MIEFTDDLYALTTAELLAYLGRLSEVRRAVRAEQLRAQAVYSERAATQDIGRAIGVGTVEGKRTNGNT